MRSKRFEYLDQRPVNQDGYALDWPEVGFIAMNSPFDPVPSIKIENGVVSLVEAEKETLPTYDQFYYYVKKNTTKQEFDTIRTSAAEVRNNKRLLLSDAL